MVIMKVIHNNNNEYTFNMHQSNGVSDKRVNRSFTKFTKGSNEDDKTSEVVFVGGETSAEDTDDHATTDSDTNESDEDGWHSSPPDDYMEHVEVKAEANEIDLKIEQDWVALMSQPY